MYKLNSHTSHILSYDAFLLHPLLINGLYLVLFSDEEMRGKIESWVIDEGVAKRSLFFTAVVLFNYSVTWFFAAIMYILVDKVCQRIAKRRVINDIDSNFLFLPASLNVAAWARLRRKIDQEARIGKRARQRELARKN